MGSIVLYILEWAFALVVLLTIYKAAFSGTTFYRFNRFYLLGATVLSALLPLVHITVPESTPLVSDISIHETEFAQELSGTFVLTDEPVRTPITPIVADEPAQPERKSSLWAVILVCLYSGYVIMLFVGWARSIIRAARFLHGKPRRRLSRTVWLVTHDDAFGPFSWMNYIVISDAESGFARRASLRHEYSHVKLLHSADLVFLLACTIVNPVCWLVLQEIKIVHEYEADHEVITHYGIRNGDYQKLLIMRTVGAEAYALASSFNLNIKKRIIMLNKNQTGKSRLIWLLILIPMLGITSVLFARTEKAVNLDDNLRFSSGKFEMRYRIPEPLIFYSSSGTSGSSVSLKTVPPPPAAVTSAETFRVIGDDEVVSDELSRESLEKNEMLIRQRNVMTIQINKLNDIYVKSGITAKVVPVDEIKDLAKQFIKNPDNNPKLPEIVDYDMEGYGTVQTTMKHIFSLQYDRATSAAVWCDVRYELQKAYNEVRDELCIGKYGKDYDHCSESEQSFARGMYPMKISEAQPVSYDGEGNRIFTEVRSAAIALQQAEKNTVNKDLHIRIEGNPAWLYASTQLFENKNGQDLLKSETESEKIRLDKLNDYIDQAISDGMKIRYVRLEIQPDVLMGVISDLKETIRHRMLLNVIQDGYKDPVGVAQSGQSMVPDIDEDEDFDYRALSRVIRPDNNVNTCIYLFDIKNLNDDKGNADVFNYGILSLLKLYEGQTSGKLNTPQMKTLAVAYESAKNELLALQKKYEDELNLMQKDFDERQEEYLSQKNGMPEELRKSREQKLLESSEIIHQKFNEYQIQINQRNNELVNEVTGKYKSALKSIAGNYQYVCISQYKGEPSGSRIMSEQKLDTYLKDLSDGKIDGFTIPYSPFDYGVIQTKLSMNYSNKAVLYL